jgi:hypothetical protein
MKVLLLLAGGRAGSDLFHSLLDEHSQILQFPGMLEINRDFLDLINLKNYHEIPVRFIKLYPLFFNSKHDKRDRHNSLGKNRKKFYTVNTNVFIKNFLRLAQKRKILRKFDIVKYLHYAYFLTRKKKIKNKKIIFIHTHLLNYTKNFVKIFKLKNIEIIHTIRNPISSINSSVKNWLRYKNGRYFFAKDLYFQFDIVFNGIPNLFKMRKKILIVQLEKLHDDRKKVVMDFCRIFNLKYERCLMNSTYFGFKWWGDKTSNKLINDSKKKKDLKINKNLFYDRDIKFLEFLAFDIINYYNYKLNFNNITNFYFIFFPMKSELLTWKNTLKYNRIKHVLSIPYFFLKRIILINKFFLKYKYLPYSLG